MTYLQKFMEVYQKELHNAVLFHPADYAYGVDKVPAVVERVREAIRIGEYPLFSHTMRSTCMKLGLKQTSAAVREYVSREGDVDEHNQTAGKLLKKLFGL